MLVKEFTISGTETLHVIKVPTIYKFVTVFNHSLHRLEFYPDTVVTPQTLLYRVPAQIYLTLPLLGAGRIAECQREAVYTVRSLGSVIPTTRLSMIFSEENLDANLSFPDPQDAPMPPPTLRGIQPGRLVSIFNITMPAANTEYFLDIPAGVVKFAISLREHDAIFRVAFEAGRVAAPTPPFHNIRAGGEYWEDLVFLGVTTRIFVASPVAGKNAQLVVWRE